MDGSFPPPHTGFYATRMPTIIPCFNMDQGGTAETLQYDLYDLKC